MIKFYREILFLLGFRKEIEERRNEILQRIIAADHQRSLEAMSMCKPRSILLPQERVK